MRRRGARNEILAATAALSLACGGVVSGVDGGRDVHTDAVTDHGEQDGDPFLLDDAAPADSGADTGVDVPTYPPPLPYGCPPATLRRVV